jgi:hypothetical protein
VSGVVGIEIGADRVRAVVRSRGGRLSTYELPFVPERINEMVTQLATAAGDVRGIGLAIGLAHLHVKQVKLPPVAHAARRQMLIVEPERWFAVQPGASTAVALTPDGDIALAADGTTVDACVRALSRWSAVRRIEAAPMALARALGAAGHPSSSAALDAGIGEVGAIETKDGVLRSVRRARASDLAAAPASPSLAKDLDPAFSVALGAALDFDGTIDAMLLTPWLERGFISAQRRRVVTWATAALLAISAAGWAAGASRERLLSALESELIAARRTATPGVELSSRVMAIDRELAAISTTTASRPDIAAALAALGARLPRAAVAQRVRVVGREWQVEGNAQTAAAVLAALAAEPAFEKVRFLAPSNRFRDGTADRETFAIAFAFR